MRRLRTPLVLAAMLSSLSFAGCLRPKFDLCADDPPHPDCLVDAGRDAAADAPVVDAPVADAAAEDAPATDAPSAEDAPATVDARPSDDAPTIEDAGPDAP